MRSEAQDLVKPHVLVLMEHMEAFAKELLKGSTSDFEAVMNQIVTIQTQLNTIKTESGSPGPNFSHEYTSYGIDVSMANLITATQGKDTDAETFDALLALYEKISKELNLFFAFNPVGRDILIPGPVNLTEREDHPGTEAIQGTFLKLHQYAIAEEFVHAIQSLSSATIFPESRDLTPWLYQKNEDASWGLSTSTRDALANLSTNPRAALLTTEDFHTVLDSYVRGEEEETPVLDSAFHSDELDPLILMASLGEQNGDDDLNLIAASMTQDAGYFSRVLYAIMQYANNESFAGMSGETLREFILDCLEEYHTTPTSILPNRLPKPNDGDTADIRDGTADQGSSESIAMNDIFNLTAPSADQESGDSDDSESTIAGSDQDLNNLLSRNASPWNQQRSEVLDLAIATQTVSVQTVPLLAYDSFASDILNQFGGSVDFIPSTDVGYMAVAYIDGYRPTILYNPNEINARIELM